MKVVITGYNTCCMNPTGGVQVRIKKIYELLSNRDDVCVEYLSPMETDWDSVDILHLFKLEPEFYSIVNKAKSKGIKVVLSSIIPLGGGCKIDFYRRFLNKFPVLSSYKMDFSILNKVDCIIAETPVERNFISKHYGVESHKIQVIPNGIDIIDYKGEDIYKLIGGKKEYVLLVGRFDTNKNQKNVILAMQGSGIDVVFIGGEDSGDASYYHQCKELAKDDPHFHFLGWISSNSNLLYSAYSNAKVFVFPSYGETFGLALLEAAISGCNLAISQTLPILGFHTFDDAYLFNPNDLNDIREKIKAAFSSDKNERIKSRVIDTFSWNSLIDQHVELYESLIKDN